MARIKYNAVDKDYDVFVGTEETAIGSCKADSWIRLSFLVKKGAGQTAVEQWADATVYSMLTGDLKTVEG